MGNTAHHSVPSQLDNQAMKLEEFKLYVTDNDTVLCDQDAGCSGWLNLPRRRVTMGDFIKAVIEHARTDHGILIEEMN